MNLFIRSTRALVAMMHMREEPLAHAYYRASLLMEAYEDHTLRNVVCTLAEAQAAR